MIDGFHLEERLRHRFQDRHIVRQCLHGIIIRFIEVLVHFFIDDGGYSLAVVSFRAELLAEEEAAAQKAAEEAAAAAAAQAEAASSTNNASNDNGASNNASNNGGGLSNNTSNNGGGSSNNTSNNGGSSSSGGGSNNYGGSVVAAAQSQLGVPYVWGGTAWGSGLDCSGLTSGCWSRAAGIWIGRTTWDQIASAQWTGSVSEAQAGDVYACGSHVAIATGGGGYIHAPQPGEVVCYSSLSWYNPFYCALRWY